MGTIVRRETEDGEVRYQARVRVRGQHVSETFARKRAAEEWIAKTEDAVKAGTYSKLAEEQTLGDLIQRYVEEELPKRPRGQQKLAALLARWRDELGRLPVAAVTTERVAAVRDKLRRESVHRLDVNSGQLGRRRSHATVNRYLQALSTLFGVAEREWGVGVNPCRKVKKLTEPKGRVRFLSDEERERLLVACRGSRDPNLYDVVVVALSTGARRGEIMALRWRDVDLQRGLATLQETKNGDRRALHLHAHLLERLKERSRVRAIDHDFVFPTRRMKRGVPWFPEKAWDDALLVAGIEDFTFHDLRHTAASYLAMNGATLAEIAEVLGHKTLAMVKRYSHLTDSHVSSVVQRMNAKVFG